MKIMISHLRSHQSPTESFSGFIWKMAKVKERGVT